MLIKIKIIPCAKGIPDKVADAELHFGDGPLAGVKLVGFAVWRRRGGVLAVTYPARSYSVNGERRSYSLIRPIDAADYQAPDRVRDLILDAYRSLDACASSADVAPAPVTPAPVDTRFAAPAEPEAGSAALGFEF